MVYYFFKVSGNLYETLMNCLYVLILSVLFEIPIKVLAKFIFNICFISSYLLKICLGRIFIPKRKFDPTIIVSSNYDPFTAIFPAGALMSAL